MQNDNGMVTPSQVIRPQQPAQPVAPVPEAGRGGSKQKRHLKRPKVLVVVIAIAVIILAIVAIVVARHVFADKPLKAFSIGTSAEKPEDDKFVSSATMAQGEALRLQMRYNPDIVKSMTMAIYKSDGKEEFNSGVFNLNDKQTEFSLAMNTSLLQPGNYTVSVKDQDKKELHTAKLTITESKKE